MKSLFLFLLFAFILILHANCQIEKNYWLTGGMAKFYNYNSEISSTNFNTQAKYTQVELSAIIGYFIADKFSIGLKPTFSSIKGRVTSTGGGSTNVQRYLMGPFCRYYLLEKEKQTNIVSEISYQIGTFGGGLKGSLNTFSALIGPELFFNSSAGIEFLIGYCYTKEDAKNAIKEVRKGIQFSIGFQLHLTKD